MYFAVLGLEVVLVVVLCCRWSENELWVCVLCLLWKFWHLRGHLIWVYTFKKI